MTLDKLPLADMLVAERVDMNGRPAFYALCFAVALASCGGGSGGSPTPGSPPPAAPTALSYHRAPTFVVGRAISPLTPTVTGTVAAYAVSPSLPAGLSLSASTGAISGTPTAVAALANYTVTASNAGGSTATNVAIAVTVQSTLLDLGHVRPISLLRLTSSRVLSLDHSNSWVLWDYAAAGKLTGALATCWSSHCVAGSLAPVDLEGPTLVDETAAGLEVRASLDGSVLAVISTPIVWWKLATDGSYLCAGSASALTVWSPAGSVVASRAGNYSTAVAFAAPGQVQIALGPAGTNVVETVALPSGTSSVTSTFQGTFNSWFLDGQHFLSNTANTVWTYTNTGVQADITALPTVENLTGQGSWFWTYSASTSGFPVNLYKVGASGSPTATYSPGPVGYVIPSGLTLGILAYGSGAGTVIDLSGSSPTTTSFTAPIAYTSAYAGNSASQWVAGNNSGVLLDGASIPGNPRYFGYGAAWSIAGSGPTVAVATASGAILYFNAATSAQEGTIKFSASQLALSSDGSVLAAAGDQQDAQYHDDWSINIYSLPSGTKTNGWPYSFASYAQGGTLPSEITLSSSGTALGQVLGRSNGVLTCSRQVTAVSGGPVLWSDTFLPAPPCVGLPVRLSPDGTKVAVSNNKSDTSGTNIYSNGILVTAVPGWVVGWLDDSRILVNTYTLSRLGTPAYTSSTIYSSAGTRLAAPPLPELQSLQIVNAGSVYDPGSNAIYSTTTGTATWTSGSPSTGVGAVAGSDVVFASGSQVLVQSF
jgi:hypothetical protein